MHIFDLSEDDLLIPKELSGEDLAKLLKFFLIYFLALAGQRFSVVADGVQNASDA